MNVIPPPPPGMLIPHNKYDGYEQMNGYFRPGSQGKRKRSPIEDQGAMIGVRIKDDGSRKYITPPGLEHVALGHLLGLGDMLENWIEVRKAEQSGRQRQKKDVVPLGQRSKSVWHCEPPEPLPVTGSVSFPFQTTFPANGVVNHPSRSVSGTSPQTEMSQDQSATDMSIPEKPVKGPIIRELAPVRPVLAIKVCDAQRWREWFQNAFKAIQQQQCRFIAKEWIKLIHPRKQSTHPYNGNFPRNHRASPERTKPPYWPKDVRHKEPDHIDKDARTVLLVHLVMQTPQAEITPANQEGRPGGKIIVAADLLGCLAKKRDELKDKWEILEQLIHARTQLEAFEEGGMDADAIVSVPDYHESSRSGLNRRKLRARAKEITGGEQTGDSDNRPESPTPPTSPTATIIATPAGSSDDDEEDEDYRDLNASLTSDVTQMSSLSSRTAIPAKYDDGVASHYHVHPVSQPQPRLMMAQIRENEMDFSRHDHARHQHPMMPNSWSTTHNTDPGLASAFAEEMLASQTSLSLTPEQFDHAMSATTCPPAANSMMYPGPYDSTQQFAYSYHHNIGRDVGYRPMVEIDHQQGYGPDFTMHNEFNNVYGPGSRRLQR